MTTKQSPLARERLRRRSNLNKYEFRVTRVFNVAGKDPEAEASGLVTEGYIASMPISPAGDATYSASQTGYVITKSSTGLITITACDSENTSSISVQSNFSTKIDKI